MLDCYGNAFCLSLCHTLNNPESQLNTWQSISVALFIYLCYLALILLIVFSSFFIFSPFLSNPFLLSVSVVILWSVK